MKKLIGTFLVTVFMFGWGSACSAAESTTINDVTAKEVMDAIVRITIRATNWRLKQQNDYGMVFSIKREADGARQILLNESWVEWERHIHVVQEGKNVFTSIDETITTTKKNGATEVSAWNGAKAIAERKEFLRGIKSYFEGGYRFGFDHTLFKKGKTIKITTIFPDSPMEAARILKDDVVLALNGVELKNMTVNDFDAVLSDCKPVTFNIKREDKIMDITVTPVFLESPYKQEKLKTANEKPAAVEQEPEAKTTQA